MHNWTFLQQIEIFTFTFNAQHWCKTPLPYEQLYSSKVPSKAEKWKKKKIPFLLEHLSFVWFFFARISLYFYLLTILERFGAKYHESCDIIMQLDPCNVCSLWAYTECFTPKIIFFLSSFHLWFFMGIIYSCNIILFQLMRSDILEGFPRVLVYDSTLLQ